MSYGPTRDKIDPLVGTRIDRLLHLDLVPGLTPLLLTEFGVPPVLVPSEAFLKVLGELAEAETGIQAETGTEAETSTRAETATTAGTGPGGGPRCCSGSTSRRSASSGTPRRSSCTWRWCAARSRSGTAGWCSSRTPRHRPAGRGCWRRRRSGWAPG